MTKAEAVKTLERISNEFRSCMNSDEREAVQMGIVALNRSIRSTRAANKNHIARAKAAARKVC